MPLSTERVIFAVPWPCLRAIAARNRLMAGTVISRTCKSPMPGYEVCGELDVALAARRGQACSGGDVLEVHLDEGLTRMCAVTEEAVGSWRSVMASLSAETASVLVGRKRAIWETLPS